MNNYQIDISFLSSGVAELENFKEMLLKENPDLSSKFKEYMEEKRKRECEECSNCCKNILIVCAIIFAIYIFYILSTSK